MCPRVTQFLLEIFSGTKAWPGCPFGCSSQCIEISPIQLLAQDSLTMVGDFCIWEMNGISKAVSALSTRMFQTVLLMSILVKDLKCFACSLHYMADESIPTFPAQMPGSALISEMCTYCFFCLSAVFTLRGTKAVWWLVWRSLIFGCFSLCFPKAGSSPQRMRDAEQCSPDALRAAKGSS